MTWTDTKSLKQQISRLWDRGILLSALIDNDDSFPRRLTFKTPTSKQLSERFDDVRIWIKSIQQIKGLRIEYRTLDHRILGSNTLPANVWLDTPQQAIDYLGHQRDAKRFAELVEITNNRAPQLRPWLIRYPLMALEHIDEWSRVLDILDWFKQHPKPRIYLRQIDLKGIDTKFIERHRGLLANLLDLTLPEGQIDNSKTGINQFEARYGLQIKPARIRLRTLDPTIKLLGKGQQDITITADNLKTLDQDSRFQQQIETVFITENEINFLTFPDLPKSIVLFGAGYGFDSLKDNEWLKKINIFYWGDIDTHGFAILDQLRSLLPQTQSILMDEPTLLAHREFWSNEQKPLDRPLQHLTTQESAVYENLRLNRYEKNARLEQERIGYNWLCERLNSLS